MSRTTEPKTLGEMLRKLREEKTDRNGKKLTLQKLEKKAKVDYSTLSKYEKDLRSVSKRSYNAILRVLEPTQRQRRDLKRLYDSATVKRPASSELRGIASRAVCGNDIKLRDIKGIKKVKPKDDKCGKYKLSMKDGSSVALNVSVKKLRRR